MSDLKYTQGVCMDGAAILKDGAMMTIEEILAELNNLRDYKWKTFEEWQEEQGVYAIGMGTYEDAKLKETALFAFGTQPAK